MEDVTIREARREDCGEINRLIKELAHYLDCSDEIVLDEHDLEANGFDAKHPYFRCLVAEAEMLVGYAFYYFTYSSWQGKALHLEDLYVMSDYRKLGLGSALFSTVAEKGYASGCSRMDFLVMHQSPAGDFYKNKGAIDITAEEGWHYFRLNKEEMGVLAQN